MYKCLISGSKNTCDKLNLQSKMFLSDHACVYWCDVLYYTVCDRVSRDRVSYFAFFLVLPLRLSECPRCEKCSCKYEPWNDTHENTKNKRIDGESHIT